VTTFYGVRFTDGPCKGKYEVVESYNISAGTVVCSDFTYYLTFHGGNTATASITPPPAGQGLKDTGAMTAWNTLRREINKTLPAELHRADQYLRSTLHELRRIRVKG
jgi:hypothetical protein